MLTGDEIILAGAERINGGFPRETSYLYSGVRYWVGLPSHFDGLDSQVFIVDSRGGLGTMYVDYDVDGGFGVRPSISLSPGTEISAGDGSYENPYVVQES